MARIETHGLRRSVGLGGLFATAYGNVGSSIYYALGLVAAYAAGLTPGQRMTHGTLQPPSQLVSFSERNGVIPPSGQALKCGPLSVEYMTMVSLAIPRSSSFFNSSPT